MAAQAAAQMLKGTLYIRTGTGVVGPYPAESVRDMAQSGALPASGAVSQDGKHWLRADRLFGVKTSVRSKPKSEVKAAAAGEQAFRSSEALRQLLNRVCDRKWMHVAFSTPVMIGVGALLLFGALIGIYAGVGLSEAVTGKRLVLFFALAVPAVLSLCAALATGGGALMRTAMQLSDMERRFLALHLPRHVLSRLSWGRFMRNWLYRGEWFFAPEVESPRAYVHLFCSGVELESLPNEVTLWDKLSHMLPYGLRDLCLPGDANRQVQPVETLPAWSERIEEVTDGYALGTILDHNYVEWARGFLGRARKRLGVRGNRALEFALAYVDLGEEAKVLAVCVYPRVKRAVAELQSPVMEEEVEAEVEEDCAAA